MSRSGSLFMNSEAQRQFNSDYVLFINQLQYLETTGQNILSQMQNVYDPGTASTANRVVFGLVQLVFEDFNEVLLLCSNGSASGAKKILRGMFERTVIAWYLSQHEAEAQAFWDFQYFRQHSEIRRSREVFPELFESLIDNQSIDSQRYRELEENFNRVRSQFEGTRCTSCRNRPMPSWTRRNIETMAREITGDYHFELMLSEAYYQPMSEIHASADAINNRRFPTDSRPMLITAHLLLIRSFELLFRYFQLSNNIDERIRECGRGWESWSQQLPPLPSE